jgi:hypothetical protein
MAYLKELIAQLPNLSRFPELAEPRQLESVKKHVSLLLGNIIPREPTAYDLLETYDVLCKTPFTLAEFMSLPVRYLKRAPWIMFEAPEEGGQILAEDSEFLYAYMEALKQRISGPAIVALVLVFLRYYPRDKSYFNYLREKLALLIANLDTPNGRLLNERSGKYGFFMNDGPEQLGWKILNAVDPVSELIEAGLDEGGSQRGFVQASVLETIRIMGKMLESRKLDVSKLDGLLRFYESPQRETDSLRFPGLRGVLADCLLVPFASHAPDEVLQSRIREFLLRNFNDPRINRGLWHEVSDEAVSVFLRWLVHATLEDFFRVVRDGSQQDKDADRMWPYREAFWTAYLNKGVISDAWVVLGEAIAVQARRFLEGQRGGYGKLERGNGVKHTHAVLILRIGDLIITEWNHMGKYRVWHVDNKNAPRFYKSRGAYTRVELTTSPDFEGTHHGANHGGWQEKLAGLIAEWTGVKLTQREFMPK